MVPLQLSPERTQLPDACIDLRKLGRDECSESRAEVLARPAVCVRDDLPDFRQGNPNLLGSPNELEPLQVFPRIESLCSGRPRGLGKEAEGLVIPDGLWVDVALSGQISDPHGPLLRSCPAGWTEYRPSSPLEGQENSEVT